MLERFNSFAVRAPWKSETIKKIMNTHSQTQDAIRTLTLAFAPLDCHIMAARKGNFSFTLVNQHGVARHTERLYPEQYLGSGRLQLVIERARKSLAG